MGTGQGMCSKFCRHPEINVHLIISFIWIHSVKPYELVSRIQFLKHFVIRLFFCGFIDWIIHESLLSRNSFLSDQFLSLRLSMNVACFVRSISFRYTDNWCEMLFYTQRHARLSEIGKCILLVTVIAGSIEAYKEKVLSEEINLLSLDLSIY